MSAAACYSLRPSDWTLYGLRRDVAQLPAGVLPVAGDLQQPACPPAWPQGSSTIRVLRWRPASTANRLPQCLCRGLRHVLAWLVRRGQRPQRRSSSGVYAPGGRRMGRRAVTGRGQQLLRGG